MEGITMPTRALLLPFTIGLIACADELPPEPIDVPSGLALSRHDETHLSGTFGDGASAIRFEAIATAADRASLELVVNGKPLRYEALAATDAHDGWYRVELDASFDAADLAIAGAALEALVAELGHETTAMSLHEASVPKLVYFVAQQSPGAWVDSLFHREYSVSTPLFSVNDDGRVCIKKTTTVTAYYDNKAGAVTSRGIVVGVDEGTSACGAGNYGCMGRCGAGCSGFGGGWTLDCLEHDACSHDLCASGGGSDQNCGDEYNHASSDIFSSCSGN
jgi:hypothetical protein